MDGGDSCSRLATVRLPHCEGKFMHLAQKLLPLKDTFHCLNDHWSDLPLYLADDCAHCTSLIIQAARQQNIYCAKDCRKVNQRGSIYLVCKNIRTRIIFSF